MKKLAISQLMEKIDDLQSRIPLSENESDLLHRSILDLQDLQSEYIKGVMFRSKAKWYQEGEKNTKYFLNLERARYNSKTCRTLLDGNTIIEDPVAILDKQQSFYSELYKSDPSIEFKLKNHSGVKVPPSVKQDINENFSMHELKTALSSMRKNKTPGRDGISVDFYDKFWELLKLDLYEMVMYAQAHGCLAESLKRGILNLIPKNGKDECLLKNLRPITLLNS